MKTANTPAPGLGMDPRAAKALSTIFCELVDAQIRIQLCTEAQFSGDKSNDTMVARAKAWARAGKCRDQITQWLMQPMTSRHLAEAIAKMDHVSAQIESAIAVAKGQS